MLTLHAVQELLRNLGSRLDVELQASGHPKIGKDGKAASSGRSPLDPEFGEGTDSDAASEADSEASSKQRPELLSEGLEAAHNSASARRKPSGSQEQLTAAASEMRRSTATGGCTPLEETGHQEKQASTDGRSTPDETSHGLPSPPPPPAAAAAAAAHCKAGHLILTGSKEDDSDCESSQLQSLAQQQERFGCMAVSDRYQGEDGVK